MGQTIISNFSTSMYVEENGYDAVLVAKRSAGVAPKLKLGKRELCTPPPSGNKAAHVALKHRGDATRSPKRRYQQSHKIIHILKKNCQKT